MTIYITKENIKCLKLLDFNELNIGNDITDSDLEYLVSNYNLEFISVLRIVYNNNITSIPILPNLTYLYCSCCHNLTNIPILPNLTTLYCSGANLTNIPILSNLTELGCDGCSSLTNIPILPSLTWLNCSNCSSLTNIQILPKLTKFICNYCINLTNIQILPNLTFLDCSECTSLTNIPILPNLTDLYYYGCSNLLLYTIPLKFIDKSKLTAELLYSAIEYNSDNIKYLENLDSSNLSTEIVIVINDIITSSVLVKPSK